MVFYLDVCALPVVLDAPFKWSFTPCFQLDKSTISTCCTKPFSFEFSVPGFLPLHLASSVDMTFASFSFSEKCAVILTYFQLFYIFSMLLDRQCRLFGLDACFCKFIISGSLSNDTIDNDAGVDFF
jgi:lipoprotein signal peptidase